MSKLLEVNNLKTYFYTREVSVPAVDGITFQINRGETVGLVGESGCGKSVTALSLMRLLPRSQARIVAGEILFQNEDLLQKTEKQMRKVRGNHISMIFQEPMTSLNPVYTVGGQISEALQLHRKITWQESKEKAIELLKQVGIAFPEKRFKEYPHQMSGGMRQRVMIAMALACQPQLLIADEPTTALDVTVQAQILEIMRDLQKNIGMSILLITHDLGVVAEMAERVIVMYAGKIVEEAPVLELFKNLQHPYTEGLLASITGKVTPKKKLPTIPGNVPNPTEFPSGCRFHPRCNYTRTICSSAEPIVKVMGDTHKVSCWRGTREYGR